MPANESGSALRLATAGIVIGVFLAGALVGAGVERWSASRAQLAAVSPPRGVGIFLPLEGLELTTSQQRQVDSILERHHHELETILRESYPRARAVGDRIQAEIEAVLTPEQRRKFAVLKQTPPRRPTPTFQKRFEERDALPPLPPLPAPPGLAPTKPRSE